MRRLLKQELRQSVALLGELDAAGWLTGSVPLSSMLLGLQNGVDRAQSASYVGTSS